MPPIRTGSSPKSFNQEDKILLALNDIKNGRIKSIHAAAKLYEIPYTTLYTRSHGRVSRADIRPNGHKLTQFKENSLAEWIISIDTRGAAPRLATVGEMANILLTARSSYTLSTVRKICLSTFINHRPKLRIRFS